MPIIKPRWYKIEAEHLTIDATQDKLTFGPKVLAKLKNFEAKFFQHEIDHLDGEYLYPKFNPTPIVINSPVYKPN